MFYHINASCINQRAERGTILAEFKAIHGDPLEYPDRGSTGLNSVDGTQTHKLNLLGKNWLNIVWLNGNYFKGESW